MKYWGLSLAVVTAAVGAYAADVEPLPEPIVSLAQIESIAQATQKQFWMLVPPMEDPLYIHPDSTVRAVDWKAFKNKTLTSQMVAEMESVNSSMYPIYRTTLVEARTGELLWYNSLDQLVWQTPAPLDYNEYLFAFEHWNVDSIEMLGTQDLLWARSSNVGLEILLLPESFMASYEEDVALEMQALALAEPMGMAMMSMPQTVTNLMMGIGTTESNEVEVGVFFPTGYTNPVDVFACTSLVDWDWSGFTNISSAGISNFTWVASEASNFSTRFWVAARSDVDSDGDGLSDSHEKYLYQTDPQSSDTDGDGISDFDEVQAGTNPLYADSDGDGMGDLAEANLAVSVAANGNGGVLVVVPQTGWYHATDPNLNLVYLGE